MSGPRPGSAADAGRVLAFCALIVLMAVVARRSAAAFASSRDLPLVLLAAGLGFLLTDFVSGLVHWLCDRFGSSRTPVLGPRLIQPFREHHADPLAMTGRGWLETNHTNGVGAGLLLCVCLPLLEAVGERRVQLFAHALLFSFATAVYLTNTFHKWAHVSEVPLAGRVLQRIGLAIAPAHHARHHAAGNGCFCITTGWLNPLLDRARLFPACERWLRRGRLGRSRQTAGGS